MPPIYKELVSNWDPLDKSSSGALYDIDLLDMYPLLRAPLH